MVGVDGGRPTSRGLPPAAVLGDGATGKMTAAPQKGFSRVWILERVWAEPVVPTVSAARAFGALVTQARPTSRGRACFVSFPVQRQSAYTADGPRAGAVRLRRFLGTGACAGVYVAAVSGECLF